MPAPKQGRHYNPQGDIGVNAVDAAVLSLGWIYRRQNEADYGIDGQIEVVGNSGVPTGRIIAVQVKSGSSFFNEANDDRIIFRPHLAHVGYWRTHALPVIVALHDPSDGTVYWQSIREDTIAAVDRPHGNFKIEIPRVQKIDNSNRNALLALTDASPRDRKLAQLAGSKALMLAATDATIIVEVDEWVNKSSGRGDLTVSIVRDDQEEIVEQFMIFAGSRDYAVVLQRLYPWADISIDEDYYDAFADDDEDVEEMFKYGSDDEIEGYRESLPAIRPYTNVVGEVDKYRLVLAPNAVAQAFLTLDEYLASEE